ncbi:MAG: DUF6107 family protein [Pseudomonadota bacterium]
MTTPETGYAQTLMLAKVTGAIAGSAISLAYMLPRGRREAAIRFFSGIAGGMLFGSPVGVYAAQTLAVADALTPEQTHLMGAGLASLSMWWIIGVVIRRTNDRTSAKSNMENDH